MSTEKKATWNNVGEYFPINEELRAKSLAAYRAFQAVQREEQQHYIDLAHAAGMPKAKSLAFSYNFGNFRFSVVAAKPAKPDKSDDAKPSLDALFGA